MNKNLGFRQESDSIGTLDVPKEAYYGVQSLRGKNNFPISGGKMHPVFIKYLAYIKKAAAQTNLQGGDLNVDKARAIDAACDEVISGKLRDEFIVDPIQGGAGTSANMNVNEVIANRAEELLGGEKGAYEIVHPNDHVNMAQSTNDVIPTAGKLTVLELLQGLLGEIKRLEEALKAKGEEFDDVIKMGRTQLQDAVPMRLGQSFTAYGEMVARDYRRIVTIKAGMEEVNLGGTAIGSAINVPEYYLDNVVPVLAELTGFPLHQSDNLFDATENLDGFVSISGVLRTCAVNLSKMCNDLRLLSSGPKTGLREINLPAKQNGSSIMPGKVNPVIPEVVSQVAYNVIGHDVTITMAAEGGQLELNAFEPIVFYNLFESIQTLRGAISTLIDNCINGITANRERCRELLENSAGLSTALCPHIGYKKAAVIAKEALSTDRPVREIVMEEHLLPQEDLEEVLDPYAMTEPQQRRAKARVS